MNRHLRVVPPPREPEPVVVPLPMPADLDALLASVVSFGVDESGVYRLVLTDIGPWMAVLPRWVELAAQQPPQAPDGA